MSVTQQEVDHAHRLKDEILQGLESGKRALWEVAKAAYEFEEIKGWVSLGYENISEWLADPEISMTKQTFYRLTRVYRALAVTRKIPMKELAALDVSKVDLVLPKIESGKVLTTEALEDVRKLGASDLRDMYRGRSGTSPTSPAEDPPADGSPLSGTVVDDEGEPVGDPVRSEPQTDAGSLEPMALDDALLEVHAAIESGAANPRMDPAALRTVEAYFEAINRPQVVQIAQLPIGVAVGELIDEWRQLSVSRIPKAFAVKMDALISVYEGTDADGGDSRS